jgi:hypothetical protein
MKIGLREFVFAILKVTDELLSILKSFSRFFFSVYSVPRWFILSLLNSIVPFYGPVLEQLLIRAPRRYH